MVRDAAIRADRAIYISSMMQLAIIAKGRRWSHRMSCIIFGCAKNWKFTGEIFSLIMLLTSANSIY